MTIGFGIIGCGMIAQFHARAIQELPRAKLVACYNRTPERAHAFAKAHDCDAHDDLREMLSRKDVDVVTIGTASGAHLEPALLAAKMGKHLLIEKPLEISVSRCQKLLEACQRGKVRVGTIFPSRFHESSQVLKRSLDQGRFGTLSLCDAYVKWYRTQTYYDSDAWRGTWRFDGGGALMNQAIHSVDLLLWLMGDVTSVFARTALRAHERIEVEDCAIANLRFACGALGSIEASTACYPGALKRIEIGGSEGSAVLQEEDLIQFEFRKMRATDAKIVQRLKDKTKTGGGAGDPKAIGHQAHAKLFQDFVKGLRSGTPSLVEGEEGVKSVALIEAIYRSAKTERVVTLRKR